MEQDKENQRGSLSGSRVGFFVRRFSPGKKDGGSLPRIRAAFRRFRPRERSAPLAKKGRGVYNQYDHIAAFGRKSPEGRGKEWKPCLTSYT